VSEVFDTALHAQQVILSFQAINCTRTDNQTHNNNKIHNVHTVCQNDKTLDF